MKQCFVIKDLTSGLYIDLAKGKLIFVILNYFVHILLLGLETLQGQVNSYQHQWV